MNDGTREYGDRIEVYAPVVAAIRWTGDNWEEGVRQIVANEEGYEDGFLDRAGNPVIIHEGGTDHPGLGDWIVRSIDGLRVVDHETFKRFYNPDERLGRTVVPGTPHYDRVARGTDSRTRT